MICYQLMINEVCTEPSLFTDPHYCTTWQLGTRLHWVYWWALNCIHDDIFQTAHSIIPILIPFSLAGNFFTDCLWFHVHGSSPGTFIIFFLHLEKTHHHPHHSKAFRSFLCWVPVVLCATQSGKWSSGSDCQVHISTNCPAPGIQNITTTIW